MLANSLFLLGITQFLYNPVSSHYQTFTISVLREQGPSRVAPCSGLRVPKFQLRSVPDEAGSQTEFLPTYRLPLLAFA